jgi:hypothetical protein
MVKATETHEKNTVFLSFWNISRGAIPQVADGRYLYSKSYCTTWGRISRQCTSRDLVDPKTETPFPRSQLPGRDGVWDLGVGMLGFTSISSIPRREAWSTTIWWRSMFYGTVQGTFDQTADSRNHQGVQEVPKTLYRTFSTNSFHLAYALPPREANILSVVPPRVTTLTLAVKAWPEVNLGSRLCSPTMGPAVLKNIRGKAVTV